MLSAIRIRKKMAEIVHLSGENGSRSDEIILVWFKSSTTLKTQVAEVFSDGLHY